MTMTTAYQNQHQPRHLGDISYIEDEGDSNNNNNEYNDSSRANLASQTSSATPVIIKTPTPTKSTPLPTWISVRYLMLVLSFIGFMCVYALRVNLSVAILAMTNSTDTDGDGRGGGPSGGGGGTVHTNSSAGSCASPTPTSFLSQHLLFSKNTTVLLLTDTTTKFHWPESVKSQVLAAFFYGYAFTQIPGPYLSDYFGSHRVFGAGVLCTAILTLFTPLAANISPWALFALRFAEGFFEGVTFPAMSMFWSYWAPLPERSRLLGICYCGSQFGTIFAIPLTGLLTDRFGWQSVFYVFGVVGCAWAAVWFVFSAHRPRESRWITTAERDFIESQTDRVDSGSKPPVPWLKFFSSAPLYGMALCHFALNWGNYTYLTELPSYMSNVLKFNITQNGLLSALPYLAMFLMQCTASILADKLRGWKRFTYRRKNTIIRRTCNVLSLCGMAVFILLVPVAGCNHVAAVAMLILALLFAGFCQGGYQVNHNDVSCEYAGTLMSITNTVATVPGFVVPAVAGWLAGSGAEQSIGSWSRYFVLSAAIFVLCAVINCFTTSGERLPWMDAYVKQHQSGGKNL